MPPKQATLGSFFKLPPGVKPPIEQTKLRTKHTKADDAEKTDDAPPKDEDEVMGGTEEASSSNGKLKRERVETETLEAKKPVKRSTPAPPSPEDVSMEDEDPIPTKRRRRNVKISDDEDEEVVVPERKPSPKVKKEKEPAKTKKTAPKKEEKDTPKSKKAAAKKEKDVSDTEEALKKSKTPVKSRSTSPVAKTKIEKAVKKGKTSPITKDEEVSAAESEAEPAEALSDDEAKPTLSTAALKDMAKALTQSKDAYPDWKAGDPVPYAAVCKTFSLIEATTKRLAKISHTTLFLRQVLRLSPESLMMVIHIMSNKLAAEYEGIELGIGESLLIKAISESCGRSVQKIKEDQKEIGDLGEVAAASRQNQKTLAFAKPKPLTVTVVHDGLMKIATTKGNSSQSLKVDVIKKLLANSSQAEGGLEAKYLIRGLEGKLRLGLAERTVLVSLAQAIICWEKEQQGKKITPKDLIDAEMILRDVYCELPSYDIIVPEAIKNGMGKLKDACKLQPGIPLKPMLAKPTKAISEVLDRFEGKRFTCEYKYDGERAQIHFVSPKSKVHLAAEGTAKATSKGVAKIFSRNSEDLSQKYPEVLASLDTWVKDDVDSFVLDCEAVAWGRDEKKILPFQQLMTRKKKDVNIDEIKVRVCIFAFDLLYLNGESICTKSLDERRQLMQKSFTPIEGEFTFAKYDDANDIEAIQVFLEESIKDSCEGLMVKMLDGSESGYEPSKRSRNWLKVKKDYLAGVGDSLDLVVVGAYSGKGKRTSVYGAFTLACYNPSKQTYEVICNIGTGFSEAVLEEFYTKLSEHVIDRPKPYYTLPNGGKESPDFWFEPVMVWEVKAADFSLSPAYRAAEGLASDTDRRGVSLRFPRFLRMRDDKKPDQATSSKQVAEMYRQQEVVGGRGGKGGVDDDFEY